MRKLTYLGLGLLICGVLVFVASSVAFNSISGDRGVDVETAGDQDALLGLEYPSERFEEERVALRSSTADQSECYVFGFICYNYYFDEELVLTTDNSPSEDLTIREIDIDDSDDDGIIYDGGRQNGDGVRHESSSNGLRIVLGDFYCSAPQESDQATVTVSILAESSSGATTIDLERTIEIECIPD